MSAIKESQKLSINDEYGRAAKTYLALPPTLEFGQGGNEMYRRLMRMNARVNSGRWGSRPGDAIVSGWIALEAAAHIKTSGLKEELLGKAGEHFSKAITRDTSEDVRYRKIYYTAKMGLIALGAYTTDPESAIEATADSFTVLMSEARTDPQLMNLRGERAGLVAEALVGAAINSTEILALPASIRHDHTLNPGNPSMSHDLQVWFNIPEAMPTTPSRLVQVKTGNGVAHCGEYADDITMLHTDKVYGKSLMTTAGAFERLSTGQELDAFTQRTILLTQIDTLKALDKA